MVKRIIIYIIGVFILGLGLVINSKTGLGVSPILSVSFVLSDFLPITFGQATSLTYMLFVLVQLIIVRKLALKILLQIPFSYLFGLIIDFYNMIITINHPTFYVALFLLLLAILLTAIGVTLMLQMELIVNPADGFVNTLAEFFGQPFGKIKLLLDVSMMGISLILCALFVHHLVGIGLGTIVAAMCTGPVINYVNKIIGVPLAKVNLASKRK